MNKKLRKTSKFLAYLLRHHPDAIGLRVNAHGWAEVDELIGKARREGRSLNRSLIKKVIYESSKNRFDLSSDGQKIRANYGHSIAVNLDYHPVAPPDQLFRRTAIGNVESIRQQGIHAGSRQYVHLSEDKQNAREVGRRHGQPIILSVQDKRMYNNGYDFYPTPAAIWLTSHVPSDYIQT
jgi:putative RNA 2'-phosphotransferase